jgi:hypothetical protein
LLGDVLTRPQNSLVLQAWTPDSYTPDVERSENFDPLEVKERNQAVNGDGLYDGLRFPFQLHVELFFVGFGVAFYDPVVRPEACLFKSA